MTRGLDRERVIDHSNEGALASRHRGPAAKTLARVTFCLFLAAPAAGRLEEPPGGVRILFGGDTYFGEHHFAAAQERGETHLLHEKGYGFSLEYLRPIMSASDHVILNLECPILDRTDGRTPRKLEINYPVHAGQAGPTERTLREAGVTAVSLGNNHALDYGESGLEETMAALDSADIRYFGAGKDSLDASRPLHMEVRIGDRTIDLFVLNAYAYREPYDKPLEFYAAPQKAGVWMLDGRAISQQIIQLRAAYPEAIIVAFPHWGWNYAWRDKSQFDIARNIIDAGADLVLGHGAHRIQEIEAYKGRWIVYGLGNFVFNTQGRYEETKSPPFSLAAQLLIRDAGGSRATTLRLYPIMSDNRLTGYQPRPVGRDEFRAVKAHLKQIFPEGSDDIGPFFELDVEVREKRTAREEVTP